ncbi:MAG: cellobiose phosphorylase, partial [Rhizobium sp.]
LAIAEDAKALWKTIGLVNPIDVTDALPHASLRQRNTYFSSSDAAFPDRYQAMSDWDQVRKGEIDVDGGWRIYSSGPGLYARSFIENILGFKRRFGRRKREPLLPSSASITIKTDHAPWRRLKAPSKTPKR